MTMPNLDDRDDMTDEELNALIAENYPTMPDRDIEHQYRPSSQEARAVRYMIRRWGLLSRRQMGEF